MKPADKFFGALVAMVGEEELARLVTRQQEPYRVDDWLDAMNRLTWAQMEREKQEKEKKR